MCILRFIFELSSVKSGRVEICVSNDVMGLSLTSDNHISGRRRLSTTACMHLYHNKLFGLLYLTIPIVLYIYDFNNKYIQFIRDIIFALVLYASFMHELLSIGASGQKIIKCKIKMQCKHRSHENLLPDIGFEHVTKARFYTTLLPSGF